MTERLDPPVSPEALRQRAEEQLRQHGLAEDASQSAVDTARLLHELQVHRIELEMQNDSLQQARDDMETLLDSYIDLYDNAPVGYLTLDRTGTIMQMNLTGARALGIERARKGQPRFGLFVSPPDRTALSDFLTGVFADGTAAAREITIARDGHPALVVQIEGSRSSDGERCRLILVDVTARQGLNRPAP
jgi:PAS domain-containing protein